MTAVLAFVGTAALLGCDDTKSGSKADGAAGTGSVGVAGHGPDGEGGAGALGGSLASGGGAGATQITAGAGGNAGTSAGAGRGGAGAGSGAGGGGGGAKVVPFEPYFHAGSRLKPRVFHVGDLEVIDPAEGGWYDTQTDNWCDFKMGTDGIERCLPRATLAAATETEPVGTYLDAACTRPAIRNVSSNCDGTKPHHVKVEPAAGCGYRTYRLGTVLPTTTRLYSKIEGSCQRLPTSSDGFDVAPLEEVPLATFVAMTRVSRPRHPSMKAWVREGDDGSSQVVGFVAPAGQAPCFGPGLNIASQACVPDGMVAYDVFSDTSCTSRIGLDERHRCSVHENAALLEVERNPPPCSGPRALKALWQLAGLSSVTTFELTNGVCQADPRGKATVYTQGAPIDVAALPQLELDEVGSGPVTVTFYGFGGVPFLPAPAGLLAENQHFTDVSRGETCTPSVFSDGTWRCVPSSIPLQMDFHLDYQSDNCTGSLAFEPPQSCSGRKPVSVAIQTLMTRDCGYPVTETREVGDNLTEGPISYKGLSMSCTVGSWDVAPKLLKVGKVLNPDDVFVTLERKLSN